jgi:hypothetical protein
VGKLMAWKECHFVNYVGELIIIRQINCVWPWGACSWWGSWWKTCWNNNIELSKSQITNYDNLEMAIIINNHCLLALFVTYDEHHVLEDDEEWTIVVKEI